MDLLEKYADQIDLNSIKNLRSFNKLSAKKWENFNTLIKDIPSNSSFELLANQKMVEIKCEENKNLELLIQELIPWRKGPFKINNEHIDSEWQCWLKWQRIEDILGEVKNLKIADIGCGNGYFMYQLSKKEPELVLGFDKSELPYQQFRFINKLAKVNNIQMELASSDSLENYKNFFDISLCMGVLYHSRNPLKVLEDIKVSLKNNGTILVETLIWPEQEEENYCFFNPDRYSKMKNVYFIPTITALISWLKKSGYKEIQLHRSDKTTTNEQRTTKYAPYNSLKEQLDGENIEQTIEGYPAPVRAILTAKKIL